MQSTALLALLERFSKAWNQHDLAQLIDCMHPECVFETVAGDAACGTHIQGLAAVQQAFGNTFEQFPDAQWLNASHWLSADGQAGITLSTFTATTAEGGQIQANMVDVFGFKEGKIVLKNAYRKQRPVQLPQPTAASDDKH
jgi:ketosteroid isomerase-like protein